MVIRVMTFEGCPNCQAALDLVKETVRQLDVPIRIEAVTVNNAEQARRTGFLGSPTIHVDGHDIEPGRRHEAGSFTCRLYRTSTGMTGLPPRSLLESAIREALAR